MTAIRAFSPKIKTIFFQFPKKGRGDLPPPPPPAPLVKRLVFQYDGENSNAAP